MAVRPTKINGVALYKQPWYGSYHSMMDRCYRKTAKNYKFYGDRGITVPDPGVRVLAANGSFVGEAYMASNGAWMRHDGFPWEVDAWMPMPDRCPPEGEEDT